jgi:hypothetical protein
LAALLSPCYFFGLFDNVREEKKQQKLTRRKKRKATREEVDHRNEQETIVFLQLSALIFF